jgi:glucosyl-3-phosphoglycerate synthase
LGRMAAQILHTASARLQREHRGNTEAPASRWLTQFRHDTASPVHHQLVVSDVAVEERPPLAEVRAVADLLAAAPGTSTWPLAHQQP